MADQKLRRDLAKLIAEHGREQVLSTILDLTKPKRGRPKILDWNELESELEADALDIINGKNPNTERSNKSIAKHLANATPRQSYESSLRRLQSKLAQNRLLYAKVMAAVMSTYMTSYRRHFEIVDDLINSEDEDFWATWRSQKSDVLLEYIEAFGPPKENMTLAEIIAHVESAKQTYSAEFGLGLRKVGFAGEKKPQH